MCGIAGILNSGESEEVQRAQIATMNRCLVHRGPDDEGLWLGPGIALGHRRLSILDPSPAGRQPMVSPGGRYAISYNGEVYNYREMGRELEETASVRLRGGSDTEVILAAIDAWGLDRALDRFNGMFAFGLWDRKERVLHLVRDRLGIKPLYYGWAGSVLLFASELKPISTFPSFERRIDSDSLFHYLHRGYVPAPLGIFDQVRKLMPGTVLSVSAEQPRVIRERRYWTPPVMAKADRETADGDKEAEALEELVRDAVRLRLVSDVPIGSFLSGGIDSSLVSALMQELNPGPVKTFSVGFETTEYDEAGDAEKVARHIGSDHRWIRVSEAELLSAVPGLAGIYDEPFADSSQIPTWILSRFARSSVTVALSGDGGDELFAGYNRYPWGSRAWKLMGRCPPGVRRSLAVALDAPPASAWDRLNRILHPFSPGRLRVRDLGEKMGKLADSLRSRSPEELHDSLLSLWENPDEILVGGGRPKDAKGPVDSTNGMVARMMMDDLMDYLPNDILTKVDRASMNCGLEVRVPLLDHRVVEFAHGLPMSLKLRHGETKWVLRQVLKSHVPPALVDKPKMGFAVPLADWLRGPLRDWAEAGLAREKLEREGIFVPEKIRQAWSEHLSGKRNHHADLWAVLMFQQWLDRQEALSVPATP